MPSGVIRLRLLVEMFRLMDMPANCRLLFPRIVDRAFDGGLRDQKRAKAGTNKSNYCNKVSFYQLYSIFKRIIQYFPGNKLICCLAWS